MKTKESNDSPANTSTNSNSMGKKTRKSEKRDGSQLLRTQMMTRQLKALVPKANTFDSIPLIYSESPISFQDVGEDGKTIINWTAEAEIFLFRAMLEHRLAGVERHFNAITIAELLTKAFGFKVTPDAIWERVHALFNCDELEDNKVPLIEGKKANEEIKDFELPSSFNLKLAAKKKDPSSSCVQVLKKKDLKTSNEVVVKEERNLSASPDRPRRKSISSSEISSSSPPHISTSSPVKHKEKENSVLAPNSITKKVRK